MIKYLLWMTMPLMASTAAASSGSYEAVMVDGIIVEKSTRSLYLVAGERPVRSYRISLGDNPRGHKMREGDKRTPEGRYTIDYRNPDSRYHLSLHISYPSPEDVQRAEQRGDDPGGMIMIHGMPNHKRWTHDYLIRKDWTDGCIAVSNRDMEEIWHLVKDGTPIEIRP